MQVLWNHLGPGPWEAILLIWASVALCWWEFIFRDIYPMGRSQKGFFFAMGLCGVCLLVMELASLAAGRGPLLEEGALTSAGAITLIGLPDGLHPGGAPGENRLGQAPSPRDEE